MKAPDKIYLPIVNLGVEDGECTAPVWWNKDKTAEHSDVVKAIEYIRKDFLLEWLDKMKEDLIKDSDFRDTEVGRYDSIVTIRYKIEQL